MCGVGRCSLFCVALAPMASPWQPHRRILAPPLKIHCVQWARWQCGLEDLLAAWSCLTLAHSGGASIEAAWPGLQHWADPDTWQGCTAGAAFTGSCATLPTCPAPLLRISHSECTYMDPQSRVLLEQTQACMTDAKLGLGSALTSNCGVCVGAQAASAGGLVSKPCRPGFVGGWNECAWWEYGLLAARLHAIAGIEQSGACGCAHDCSGSGSGKAPPSV